MKPIAKSLALLSIGAIALVGCGSNSSSSSQDTVKVVTTTDVYADVVRQVAGDHVEVTSLISSTSQDPHSYEATASDRLTVKDADVVVLNGGGYDQFLEDMAGKDNPDQKVIKAVEVSGLFDPDQLKELSEGHSHDEDSDSEEHHHEHGSTNEHVWYSFDAMKKLSDALATDLGAVDSQNSQKFTDNSAEFNKELDRLSREAESLNSKDQNYIATEPVPGYLLQKLGMEDATPTDFTSAIESGSDISPLTLQEVKEQLKDGSVDFLAFNDQTASNQTNEVLKTAEDEKIPHVAFTETLPEGKNYVEWMNDNISHLKEALEK